MTFLKASCGGLTVMPDLSVVVSRVDSRAVRYVPQRFTAAGAPVYDLAAAETLVEGAQAPTSSGGDQALVDPSGWTVLTVAPKPFAPQSLGGAYRGQPRWSYPDLWPGLHASHESPPPDRPGELIGTTRLLGGFVTPRAGDAGPLWAVNGNQGNIYLFTADGLFVAELFHDVRRGRSWAMPLAQRGMRLNDVTPARRELLAVDHADRRRRDLPGRRRRGRAWCASRGWSEFTAWAKPRSAWARRTSNRAREYLVQGELERQREQGRPTLRVPLRKVAPTVDGKLDDWADASWATVDKSGVAAFFDSNSKPYNVTATVAVAGDRLYAAFRTGDPNLLQNSGETPLAPFKSGGGLDLMIGADPHADDARQNPVPGDLRLLVTLVRGKPRGLIYRPVVPGTKEPVPFSSPWRTDHHRSRGRRERPVAVRGRRGQLRVLDPAGRLGSEAGARPGDSGRLGRPPRQWVPNFAAASIGATRPPASPATCPARPCLPQVSGAVGYSRKSSCPLLRFPSIDR